MNALIHSSLLYWLPLMALKQDVAWANGRDGGYLLLGNFVYTVSLIHFLHCNSLHYCPIKEIIYVSCDFLVCCSNGMCEGGSNNKFMDMGHPLGDMGIHYTLVLIYFYI